MTDAKRIAELEAQLATSQHEVARLTKALDDALGNSARLMRQNADYYARTEIAEAKVAELEGKGVR